MESIDPTTFRIYFFILDIGAVVSDLMVEFIPTNWRKTIGTAPVFVRIIKSDRRNGAIVN